jgi:hypothetical protein
MDDEVQVSFRISGNGEIAALLFSLVFFYRNPVKA